MKFACTTCTSQHGLQFTRNMYQPWKQAKEACVNNVSPTSKCKSAKQTPGAYRVGTFEQAQHTSKCRPRVAQAPRPSNFPTSCLGLLMRLPSICTKHNVSMVGNCKQWSKSLYRKSGFTRATTRDFARVPWSSCADRWEKQQSALLCLLSIYNPSHKSYQK